MPKYKPSSTEIQESVVAKAEAAGVDPTKLAEMMLLAELMKQPSALEQKKQDEEDKRYRENLLAQAQVEVARTKNQEHEQKYCPHRRDDGVLTFTGQVLSNGVAIVFCLRCQKAHAWMASEQEKSQGLNFMDKHSPRAVDESQLIAQEKMFPVNPEILRALGKPMLAAKHEEYFAERKHV